MRNTAQLPQVELEARPRRLLGANTADCLHSGIVYGTAAMLDGMCDRIEAELGYPAVIVATGGLGREIVPHCRRKITYVDDLLLEGLRMIYEKNKGNV